MYYGNNGMGKSKPWKHVYPDNIPEICDAFPEPCEHFRVNMLWKNVFRANIGWPMTSGIFSRIRQCQMAHEWWGNLPVGYSMSHGIHGWSLCGLLQSNSLVGGPTKLISSPLSSGSWCSMHSWWVIWQYSFAQFPSLKRDVSRFCCCHWEDLLRWLRHHISSAC